jgi:ABC-type glycerol-3-phosphate transport system permease component
MNRPILDGDIMDLLFLAVMVLVYAAPVLVMIFACFETEKRIQEKQKQLNEDRKRFKDKWGYWPD